MRAWLLTVVLLVGLAKFSSVVAVDVPITKWLLWRYPTYWALAFGWAATCFSCGHAILKRVLRAPLPLLEHVSMCFAVGTLSFFMLMFAGGLAKLFGPVFFVALPLAMLAATGPGAVRYLRRLFRHLIHARGQNRPRIRVASVLLWSLGAGALLLFYLPCIVPSHIGYDSAWYHVPLAEHYASLGGIAPLDEGWYAGTIAHLPSLVYCWAFLMPRSGLFDHIELSAHLEFAVALMMLPAIPALVRRIVPGVRGHASWIAFFAFPSVYVYDLLIGGDQFSALWSAPIALALLRVLPTLCWRHGIVLAVVLAGEALTKYSASGILIFPALAVTFRMLWLCGRSIRRGYPWAAAARHGSGAVVVGVTALALTAPLWAKNWIWYGNPIHPVLHAHFSTHPWSEDATAYFDEYWRDMAEHQPARSWSGVKETLLALVNHSFESADFAPGQLAPYRGSLFTLMCACLPFVRASGRLWMVAALANVAILGWYWQMHQDRYLLAFMPVMAAIVAAIAILAWRASLSARVLLTTLIAIHTISGLGIFALAAPSRHYREVIDFIATASKEGTKAGMSALSTWASVAKTLPKDAKVLVHGMHLHAGLGRPAVTDWPLMQSGISYGRMPSAAAMFRRLRAMGVTHITWQEQNWADDSLAGDLRFFEFVKKHTDAKPVGTVMLGKMPEDAPPENADEPIVAFFGCGDVYAAGLYHFSAMAVPNTKRQAQPVYPAPTLPFTPATNTDPEVESARFVVFNPACGFAAPTHLERDFLLIGRRDAYALYARKDPP